MSSFELFSKLNNDLFEESSISIEPYSFSYISDFDKVFLDFELVRKFEVVICCHLNHQAKNYYDGIN